MSRKTCCICAALAFLSTILFSLVQADMLRPGFSGEAVGILCVSSAFPAIEADENPADDILPAEIAKPAADAAVVPAPPLPEIVSPANTIPAAVLSDSDLLVILYHTHATESYQPYSDGNFHTVNEEGTVRQVGNVLAEELTALGVTVIHDTTIHDSPSYNKSYSRSLETIQALLEQYPEADCIIDLHRDAAAYTGNKGKTVTINGEASASYSLVVGQGNANAAALNAFAEAVNAKADALYPGFSGRIISKDYRYNEYISDSCLLLEIGNNENHIREAEVCAKYFAQVIAAVLAERE